MVTSMTKDQGRKRTDGVEMRKKKKNTTVAVIITHK